MQNQSPVATTTCSKCKNQIEYIPSVNREIQIQCTVCKNINILYLQQYSPDYSPFQGHPPYSYPPSPQQGYPPQYHYPPNYPPLQGHPPYSYPPSPQQGYRAQDQSPSINQPLFSTPDNSRKVTENLAPSPKSDKVMNFISNASIVANKVMDFVKPASECMGCVKAVISVIDRIYQIYQQVKANNQKALRLYQRLNNLKPPLNKLNDFLNNEKSKAEKNLSTDLEVDQVINLLSRLQQLQTLVNSAEKLIKDWAQNGKGFFGALKKAFYSKKFESEFDDLRSQLKDLLADLTADAVIHNLVKLHKTSLPETINWSDEDESDDSLDRKNLPVQIDKMVGGNQVTLKQFLQEVDWDFKEMKIQFARENLAISSAMKELDKKLDNILEKENKILGGQEEIKTILLEMKDRNIQSQVTSLKLSWKNPQAGTFWENSILRMTDSKSVSCDEFLSALFNHLADQLIAWEDFEKIKQKLIDLFDRNRDGKIDIWEFDKTTEKESPLEIIYRLLKELKSARSLNNRTSQLLLTPIKTVESIVMLGPKYPNVIAEHAALIKILINKVDVFSDYRIQNAFQSVPRHLFLPNHIPLNEIYEDKPFFQDPIHQSAPHMYAICMGYLKIDVRSKLPSFLCIGSGTGYLNTMVAVMQQWLGINHGIEVNEELVNFSKKNISNFSALCNVKSNIVIFSGNCFRVQLPQKYDRIYVGAACPEHLLDKMVSLLADGGRLLVPVAKSNKSQQFELIERKENQITRRVITDVSYKLLVLPSLSSMMESLSISFSPSHVHEFAQVLGGGYSNGFICDICKKSYPRNVEANHCVKCKNYDVCMTCTSQIHNQWEKIL